MEQIAHTKVVVDQDREVTVQLHVDVDPQRIHQFEEHHILVPAHKCKISLQLFVHMFVVHKCSYFI